MQLRAVSRTALSFYKITVIPPKNVWWLARQQANAVPHTCMPDVAQLCTYCCCWADSECCGTIELGKVCVFFSWDGLKWQWRKQLPMGGIAQHSQEVNLLAMFVWGISLTLRVRKVSSGNSKAVVFSMEPLCSEIHVGFAEIWFGEM